MTKLNAHNILLSHTITPKHTNAFTATANRRYLFDKVAKFKFDNHWENSHVHNEKSNLKEWIERK